MRSWGWIRVWPVPPAWPAGHCLQHCHPWLSLASQTLLAATSDPFPLQTPSAWPVCCATPDRCRLCRRAAAGGPCLPQTEMTFLTAIIWGQPKKNVPWNFWKVFPFSFLFFLFFGGGVLNCPGFFLFPSWALRMQAFSWGVGRAVWLGRDSWGSELIKPGANWVSAEVLEPSWPRAP